MSCNVCENGFESYQSLVPSIETDDGVYLWLTNQGTNILQVTRILLCYFYPDDGGSGVMYLRPPGEGGIDWLYPSATLEQGLAANFYQIDGFPDGTTFQAQAEYVEVQDRARSCAVTIGG